MTVQIDIREARPFPVLVADIGGTNARFGGLVDATKDLNIFEAARTKDYPGIIEAVEDKVTATGFSPRCAILALAGPIRGNEVALTNCPWVIRPKELIDHFGLDEVILVNDFEAQGLALPSLTVHDLSLVNGLIPPARGTKLVVGPGTGLGAGGLVDAAGRWVPVPGEGGHMDLGPVQPDEFELWPYLNKEYSRYSGETFLCGRGLVRLYHGVAKWHGAEPLYMDPSAITSAALSGEAIPKNTMDLFCRFLGRVAGNLALVFMAKGGVYLAGGISQKIADFLIQSDFYESFAAKAPHDAMMRSMPVAVVTHDAPALMGLAAFARQPGSYGVEIKGRLWSK